MPWMVSAWPEKKAHTRPEIPVESSASITPYVPSSALA
jgi:hypothetical protein